MPPVRPPGWARRTERRRVAAGAAAGLVLVAAGAGLAGVPAAGHGPSAAVTVRVAPSPEVDARPPLAVRADALGLTAVSGRVRVRALTGRALRVRVRARADVPDLDEALVLRVAGPGGAPVDATLRALREGAPGVLVLPAGRWATLTVSARIAPGRLDAVGGLGADVQLELVATAPGGPP